MGGSFQMKEGQHLPTEEEASPIDCLGQDLIYNILSRLPMESVFKSKSLSKRMYNLINDPSFAIYYSQNRRLNIAGFFYEVNHRERLFSLRIHYYKSRQIFFPINTEVPTADLPKQPLSFLQKGGKDLMVLDSCNGLLFCAIQLPHKKTYCVCNPLTRQWVDLPSLHKYPDGAKFALLSDPSTNQFKAICLFLSKKCSDFEIFSSETGEWKEYEVSHPSCFDGEITHDSKVYFNGSLYWDCLEDHIFICNVKEERFKLIEAPNAEMGRSLWEYEGKLLCYCHSYTDDFLLCSLYSDRFEPDLDTQDRFSAFAQDICKIYDHYYPFRWEKIPTLIQFRILGSNRDSDTVFFWHEGVVFSYDVTRRRLDWVGGHRANAVGRLVRAFPYVPNMVSLPGAIQLEKQGKLIKQ